VKWLGEEIGPGARRFELITPEQTWLFLLPLVPEHDELAPGSRHTSAVLRYLQNVGWVAAGRRHAEALKQLTWAREGCADHAAHAIVRETEDAHEG
jgi:hypothetical protein